MKLPKFAHPSSLILIALLLGMASANACPRTLHVMRTQHLGGDTLCAVADRYTAVKIALKKLGKVPTQIADATAPRFIDRSTWEKVAADKKYSPWFIYDPAPETWRSGSSADR